MLSDVLPETDSSRRSIAALLQRSRPETASGRDLAYVFDSVCGAATDDVDRFRSGVSITIVLPKPDLLQPPAASAPRNFDFALGLGQAQAFLVKSASRTFSLFPEKDRHDYLSLSLSLSRTRSRPDKPNCLSVPGDRELGKS